MVKLNLVVSDPHCGSSVGLTPPDVELQNGTSRGFGSNKALAWLWGAFCDMQNRVKELVDGDPFILTINGDLTEGSHHHTNELIAVDIIEHVAIAKEAFKNLVRKAHSVKLTKGTECHTREMETVFLKECGIPGKAQDVQQYEVNGCLVDARHHMPTTSRKHLEAGMLSIVMADTISHMVRAHHPVPRVFLRAHRHCGGAYTDDESLIAVTGAWQFLTRYSHKAVTPAIPRPSAILLDWRHRKRGELPIMHTISYNPPHEILHL